MSFLHRPHEQPRGHGLPERPTFALSSQDCEGSASVRPPHKTLPCWRAGPAPGGGSASQPGSWSSRQAAGARPSASPFHPSFTPRRYAGWRGFSAHSRGRAGEAMNCRASRLWRAWNPSPLRPGHSAGALGARKRLGFVSRHCD